MKKCIYLLALLLIPAVGMSQKKMVEKGAKEVKVEKTSTTRNGQTKAMLQKQLAVVKSAITFCDDPKVDCAILDEFARKIAKKPMKEQMKGILSSGFGSNFMTEMVKLEKMLVASKVMSEKEMQTAFKKSPSYTLLLVKTRVRMHEKRMEMVYDDDDDE